MTNIYREKIIAKIKNLLNDFGSTSLHTHQGVKGREREIFIEELLKPLLYPTMGIGTGVIIDSYGNQSRQIDIIIYDKNIVQPITLGEQNIVLVESVLMTIEVKSALNKEEIRKSVKNAISVKSLIPHYSIIKGQQIHSINCSVFAYTSDLKEKWSEITRLDEVVNEENEGSKNKTYIPISNLCIADTILWYCYDADRKQFCTVVEDEDYSHVLFFISNILSTCSQMANERGRPLINNYFLKIPDPIKVINLKS